MPDFLCQKQTKVSRAAEQTVTTMIKKSQTTFQELGPTSRIIFTLDDLTTRFTFEDEQYGCNMEPGSAHDQSSEGKDKAEAATDDQTPVAWLVGFRLLSEDS